MSIYELLYAKVFGGTKLSEEQLAVVNSDKYRRCNKYAWMAYSESGSLDMPRLRHDFITEYVG